VNHRSAALFPTLDELFQRLIAENPDATMDNALAFVKLAADDSLAATFDLAPHAVGAFRRAVELWHRDRGATAKLAELRLATVASGSLMRVAQAVGHVFEQTEMEYLAEHGLTRVDLTKAQLDTILGALRYYQRAGMGEPAKRPDWLQEIVAPDIDSTSLDASGIDELCEQINFS
jgi:hypothetical protein